MEADLRHPVRFEKALEFPCDVIRRERPPIAPAKHIITVVIAVAEKLLVLLLLCFRNDALRDTMQKRLVYDVFDPQWEQRCQRRLTRTAQIKLSVCTPLRLFYTI